MRVDATSYSETASAIASLARAGRGGVVCVATVHMVMESFDDPAFRAIVNAADRVTPDGVPLVWALRHLGIGTAERVYGPSLLPVVCERARLEGFSVGFYGGDPEILRELTTRIAGEHPGLSVDFAFAPPFRPLCEEELAAVARGIEASGVQILFVGLGCPKQERFMASLRSRVACVMVGVGAAFDFHTGRKPQASAWLQRAGLEWLFRLICEPRRLWRRYLYQNPRFVLHVAREWLFTSSPGSKP
jgi:N-acetylglucosaminyldiphosphoundecaprenol N-acetyl-beta-D-mannosaminyltransferase